MHQRPSIHCSRVESHIGESQGIYRAVDEHSQDKFLLKDSQRRILFRIEYKVGIEFTIKLVFREIILLQNGTTLRLQESPYPPPFRCLLPQWKILESSLSCPVILSTAPGHMLRYRCFVYEKLSYGEAGSGSWQTC